MTAFFLLYNINFSSYLSSYIASYIQMTSIVIVGCSFENLVRQLPGLPDLYLASIIVVAVLILDTCFNNFNVDMIIVCICLYDQCE